MNFMRDGGMLMWPILIAGVVTILAAARNLVTRHEGIIDPRRMARGIFAVSVAWSLYGLRLVCGAAHSGAPPRVFVLGIGEAVTAAILGFAILGIVTMLCAVSRSSVTRG